MKQVFLASSPESSAPLSGVYEANGLFFVSGCIHLNTEGKVAGNTIEEKLNLTIESVKKKLAEANLTLDNVIRVNLYLTDLTQLPALNLAYITYFKHPLPARTAVGVSALPLGANLEMDVIAAR